MAHEPYAGTMNNYTHSADALREINLEEQEIRCIEAVQFAQNIGRITEIGLQAVTPLFAWKFTLLVYETSEITTSIYNLVA